MGAYSWSFLFGWLRPYCGSIHMIPSIRMAMSILWIHVLLDAYSCIIRHDHQRCQICICICIFFICRSPGIVVLVLALNYKASQPSLHVLPSCFRGQLLHNILSHLLFTSCSIFPSSKTLTTVSHIHHDIQMKSSPKNRRKTALSQF